MEDGAAIAGSPHDPDIIFTAGFIYLNSVYWFQTSVTADGGLTWRHDTVEPQRRANAVAFDLANPDRVYLGGDSSYSSPMLKTSTDLGQTWVESHAGLSGSVAAIATVHRSPGTLFCGTTQGLYRSTDAGVSWTRQGSMSAVRAVVVDSVNTSIVYAGTAGGVYVTTDGGLSWNPFNDGLGSTDILALALRSGPGGQLFAGTNGRGLFRTVPLAGLGSEGAAAGLRGAGLSIDPNPATGGLAAIRLSPFAMGHSPCAVGIFDAAGRCVRSAVCNLESEMTLDIRGLRPGVYLVKLESTGFTAARKLVVQR